MKMHKSITSARVVEAVKRELYGTENPGFCTSCGEEAEGCEPDARNYVCESCDKCSVFGAQELMMEMV
tara:strand:- start:828 stop:1031 length:204 start_codon:yes stop_codon:yes gene_type:complete